MADYAGKVSAAAKFFCWHGPGGELEGPETCAAELAAGGQRESWQVGELKVVVQQVTFGDEIEPLFLEGAHGEIDI
ncbi:MAG: hypothetical protein ACKOGA_22020, partial [Planctomycetaceae bacterium]